MLNLHRATYQVVGDAGQGLRCQRVAMKRGVCVELALSLEENLDRESGMLVMCCHHRGVRNQVRLSLQSTGICS